MKKVLSMLLALVMVLTMAAFPVFAAEPVAITVSSVTADAEAAEGKIASVIDGNPGSYFKTASIAQGNGTDPILTLTFDLGMPYDITSLNMNWGSCRMAKAIVYGANSADATEWNVIHNFSAAPTWIYDSASGGNTTSAEVTSEGYYRYIKFEVLTLNWAGQVAIREITFNGVIDPSISKLSLTADMFTTSALYTGGNPYKSNTVDVLFDGSISVNGDDTTTTDVIETAAIVFNATQSGEVIIDLGDKYDLASMGIWWGIEDSYWGAYAPNAYTVEVSADGVDYTPVYSVTGAAAARTRADNAGMYGDANGVQYVKINVTACAAGDSTAKHAAIREIEVYGAEAYARIPATYTVKYQSDDPNFVAPADKVVEGKYVGSKVTETAVAVDGYVCDEPTKSITLVDGTNEIEFVYRVKTAVPYTVKYVDALGNPIADAKTGEAYEGEVISENAPNFYAKGYFINGTDLTKKMELALDSDNEITFVYKKIIKVSSFTKTLLNGTQGLWNVNRMYNGEILGDYDQLNTTTTTEAPYAEMVFVLDGLYAIDKMTTYWGSNNANAVSIYVSMDGINWGDPVYAGESNDVKTTFVNGDASTAVYVAEFDLGDTLGQYVKYVVEDAPSGWLAIREFTFEGVSPLTDEIELTSANVIENKNLGVTVTSEGKLGSLDSLFDGESATSGNACWANTWYGEKVVDVLNGVDSKGNPYAKLGLTIDLGAVYDVTYISLQAGISAWGTPALTGYEIYVAGIDKEFRLADSVSKYEVGTSVTNFVATDVFAINEDAVRYVKLVVTEASGRPALGEFDVYGDKVDFTAEPEKAAASRGGQIRLPAGSLSAGIRFGATIMKEAIEEGDTYGMFLLPAKMLDGNATLADYITNGGTEALDVPAARIYAEDDYSITFTAVLIGIPDTDYDTDIIAVPYIKKGNEYVFFAEMTRNYKEVATSVAASYEAGEITLTAEQITLIEGIIGRTLVVA